MNLIVGTKFDWLSIVKINALRYILYLCEKQIFFQFWEYMLDYQVSWKTAQDLFHTNVTQRQKTIWRHKIQEPEVVYAQAQGCPDCAWDCTWEVYERCYKMSKYYESVYVYTNINLAKISDFSCFMHLSNCSHLRWWDIKLVEPGKQSSPCTMTASHGRNESNKSTGNIRHIFEQVTSCFLQ